MNTWIKSLKKTFPFPYSLNANIILAAVTGTTLQTTIFPLWGYTQSPRSKKCFHVLNTCQNSSTVTHYINGTWTKWTLSDFLFQRQVCKTVRAITIMQIHREGDILHRINLFKREAPKIPQRTCNREKKIGTLRSPETPLSVADIEIRKRVGLKHAHHTQLDPC